MALSEVRCIRLLSAATENGAVPVPDARLVKALIHRESRIKDRLVSQVDETVGQRVILMVWVITDYTGAPAPASA